MIATGVAVVGGGLVGSLLAIFLSRRGHDVIVYERRPDLRGAQRDGGRSINLVLTSRGLDALARVGLEVGVSKLTVPVRGRMIHALDGKLAYQPYGRNDTECNHSISRGALNRFLVLEATGRGVRFCFDHRLVRADFDAGLLELHDDSRGLPVEVRSRVTMGADGAGSTVRAELARQAGFQVSIDMLGHDYKELLIPAAADGSHLIEKSALHIWPRGDRMLMALPNVDGSFTATLYLPRRGASGFSELETREDVQHLFEAQFPDALPLVPGLLDEFFSNPTGELGTVRCDPWHHRDRVLLIGDAAHAIVPFFGQGMNSGFEDCAVLDDLLEAHGPGDWERIFPEFTLARKTDADAMADMALENFVEMRDRVGDERFLLRKQIEHRLEQELPGEYRSRYSMVMYSSIPYREAFEAGRIQQGILDELCLGLQSVDALDMEKARRLIAQRLSPFLAERSIDLTY